MAMTLIAFVSLDFLRFNRFHAVTDFAKERKPTGVNDLRQNKMVVTGTNQSFCLQTAFLTIVLLPIRVLIICALLITAWLLACIGLWGLDEEDLQKRPLAGWRR